MAPRLTLPGRPLTVSRETLRQIGYDALFQELTYDERAERNRRRHGEYKKAWSTTAYTGQPIERNWGGIDYVEFLNTKTGEVVRLKRRVQAIWRLRFRAFVDTFGGRGENPFTIADVMLHFRIDRKTAVTLVERTNRVFGRQTAEIDQTGEGCLRGRARYRLWLDLTPDDAEALACSTGPGTLFDREAARQRRAEYDARQAEKAKADRRQPEDQPQGGDA